MRSNPMTMILKRCETRVAVSLPRCSYYYLVALTFCLIAPTFYLVASTALTFHLVAFTL